MIGSSVASQIEYSEIIGHNQHNVRLATASDQRADEHQERGNKVSDTKSWLRGKEIVQAHGRFNACIVGRDKMSASEESVSLLEEHDPMKTMEASRRRLLSMIANWVLEIRWGHVSRIGRISPQASG
jgi:hypothetical protein